MKNNSPPLYLIDAYGLIYRSYFAFLTRPLRNNAGKNVSALFGFARTLVSLLDDGAPHSEGKLIKPQLLAAIFDSRTPTFRHQMYSEYKANRQKTPDDLHEQVPLVEEFLNALGIPCLKVDGFEADDIIATLAEKCRSENRQCYILSSDKDLLQLVGNGIYELRPTKINRSETGPTSSGPTWSIVGSDEVKTEWGVEPAKVLDLLSLTGDNSDNIPGVKGIGEKTAVKLMARYGSLDEIYKNIAAIEGSTGKKLSEGKENAYFSQLLIRLRNDVDLPVKNINDLSIENLDRSAGAKVLIREGIRQSAKQLDQNVKPMMQREHSSQNAGGSSEEPAGLSPADQPILGDGAYKTILDIEELKALLEQAKKQKYLALDFETDSLDAWNSQPVGISIALKPKKAFYVPLVHHGELSDMQSQFVDPQEVRVLLSSLFADSEMTVVAHNAKYDYKVSRGWGIDRWKCKIWDTMIASWLVDPERSNYSLDSLASYTFDCTPIKYIDIVPKGHTFAAVSLETATKYSGEDSDYCLRLKHYLEPLLKKAEAGVSEATVSSKIVSLFENLEMPLLPILAEMEGEGIKIEASALTEYSKELTVELDQIQETTWETVGHKFNLSSTKQLQEVLFVERKLTPGKKTKTGYSTDAAALEELAREDPVPALILRHRTLSKLKSTYVDTLAAMTDSEGRLHTNFVQTGTATGRLSSRGPNLQNIPIRTEEGRRIREAFVAKPGCILISADYSQIELVILAHLSKDENLISAFKEDKDVHAQTAALIFGIDKDKVNSDQRRMAKTINFGVMYGMSAFRLANELNISRTDANNFIDAYFKTYSGVWQFIKDMIKKTEQTGYVTTILGRRRYIPTINSSNKTEKAAAERIALNTPIQ
jgi:DNA polymerase-1